jgi:hypothetical protein
VQERLHRPGYPRIALGKVPSVAITFAAVLIAWVYFRSDDFASANRMLAGLAGLNGISLPTRLGTLQSLTANQHLFAVSFDDAFVDFPQILTLGRGAFCFIMHGKCDRILVSVYANVHGRVSGSQR